jgi:hypothetical protein
MAAPIRPAQKSQPKRQAAPADQTIEILVCETCGASFDGAVIDSRPRDIPADGDPAAEDQGLAAGDLVG